MHSSWVGSKSEGMSCSSPASQLSAVADWLVFPLLEAQVICEDWWSPRDTRNCPELTGRAVEALGPTCSFILDTDPAAFLFQVQGAPRVCRPVENILNLNDLPQATTHGDIVTLAGQTLADTCTGKVIHRRPMVIDRQVPGSLEVEESWGSGL